MTEPDLPIWRRPQPPVPSVLRMVKVGVALAVASSLVNGNWSKFGRDAWRASHADAPQAMVTLGIGLSAMLIFPLAQLILLAVVLPVLARFSPAVKGHRAAALAVVAVPTLAVAWIWLEPQMIWAFTLPATLCTFGATGILVLLVRSGWADLPPDV